MATVVMHAVASLDGFIADANDDAGPRPSRAGTCSTSRTGGRPGRPRVTTCSSCRTAPSQREGGRALELGLVDEVAIDVVPVVFGSGQRYFGSVEGQHLLEDPDVVVAGDRVLHLRYRVRRPAGEVTA